MLQIKDVTKEYRMHDVYVVKALDHVSVTFPEKGMVFLIGKSGSGKSTLLNISGGLDMPDSGEIILKGRSSKDFTPSDFDCYRNTFVGFIFQEYNVLDEFTVEDNIAVALELQGKAKDEKAIEELLKEVDLEGLGKRRPNTLSGGQKQRVAIARALVKNPEIIMADEPTGALDSATGKQVFDTLKKLSEKKLVLVVSHDREFAETYGDRIIELKDGKIISDKSKTVPEGKEEDNLALIGEKTLSVKSDKKLSKEQVEKIVSFLQSNGEKVFLQTTGKNIFLATDEAEMEEIKNSSAFSSEEEEARFVDTDTAKVDEAQYDGKDVSFIKSKLPFRHAIKLGTSSLRIKPFKLAFTALLATVAFIVFGMLSTLLTYSEKAVTVNAIETEGYSAVAFTKEVSFDYVVLDDDRSVLSQVSYSGLVGRFDQEDIDSFNEKHDSNAVGVYNYNSPTYRFSISDWLQDTPSYYYRSNLTISGFCDLSDKNLADYGLTLVAGTYPEGDKEIAIPLYLYQAMADYGTVNGEVSSYEDVIGQSFRLLTDSSGDLYVTVTGIIDCGEIPDLYEPLRDVDSLTRYETHSYNVREMSGLIDRFQSYYRNSFHSLLFVGSGFYESNYSVCTMATRSFVSQIKNFLAIDADWVTEYLCDNATYQQLKKDTEARNNFIISEYCDSEEGIYQYIYYPIQSGKSSAQLVLKLRNSGYEDNETFAVDLQIFDSVDDATSVVSIMRRAFIVAGVILALFAALLLSNFISVSIRNKEKKIGILRAVGARGPDVFKIFICEALVITLICFVLASVGTTFICSLVNAYMIEQVIVDVSIFLFRGWNVLMICLIALGTAFAATYFPVKKAVQKKPVEVIRAL